MPKKYAPRLAKTWREPHTVIQDPLIREGLEQIAKKEKKSVSRILEEVMIDYFDLKHSLYYKKKNNVKPNRQT